MREKAMDSNSTEIRIRRTPRACQACRRRKTKCDGVYPTCRYCSSRQIDCRWPNIAPGPHQNGRAIETSDLIAQNLAQLGPASSSTPDPSGQSNFPTINTLRRSLDIFYERHLPVEFCSFIQASELEGTMREKAFLVYAIIALSSRYLTEGEARRDFQLPSGKAVYKHYVLLAKRIAKNTCDEPNVTNIQGNLVLALAELLSWSAYSHWTWSGIAIRMAQAMRLNREYHQRHSLREQEIRRRTFWACLVFDRLTAFCCCKPHTLSLLNVYIPLPCSESALAYGEPSHGLKIETLASYQGSISSVGLLPYFIVTVNLWGDLADIHSSGGRMRQKTSPTDPSGRFYRRTRALVAWRDSLPKGLQWNEENYQLHRSLRQDWMFTSMHFLLRSALCVAHQGYLPQADPSSFLLDALDGAGLSLMHRDPELVGICTSNAVAIAEMVLNMAQEPDRRINLQSTFVASSMLSAASALLWLHHVDETAPLLESPSESPWQLFNLLRSIIESWQSEWAVAKAWKKSFDSLEKLYRRAYLPDEDINSTSLADSEQSSDEESQRQFLPRPGEGLPQLDEIPSLWESLRLAILSPYESSIMQQKLVWLRLTDVWPHDLVDSPWSASTGSHLLPTESNWTAV